MCVRHTRFFTERDQIHSFNFMSALGFSAEVSRLVSGLIVYIFVFLFSFF